MAKGYSFQGLVDSVLMKLNLLSEIKEQGKKAQKEARDNLDVYGKEQTYNKSETDNQISLVVDDAPSNLNTLNKLAQAINNNPKFAEKIHLLLDKKLSKSDNGADIPDKNLFVKNLGLTEAVDCAKNALDKRTGGTVNGPLTVEGSVNATAPAYLVKSGIIHDKANNVRNTQGLRLQGEGAQGSDIFFWEQIGKSAAMKFHVWSGGRAGRDLTAFVWLLWIKNTQIKDKK